MLGKSNLFVNENFNSFNGMESHPGKATAEGIEELAKHKIKMMKMMQEKYPEIMPVQFNGEIAFRLCRVSPEEMIKKGGFHAGSNETSDLWFNSYTGDNQGSICFSLLPEVVTVFTPHIPNGKKAYLYAFPLVGDFLATGGRWRQVIAPGAFPITPWWAARELIQIKQDNQIELGPMVGHKGDIKLILDERFKAFYDNTLVKPQEYDLGEDYPLEYEIKDTPATKVFQEKVEAHYRNPRKSSFTYTS